eukprot:SAG11_NODE_5233_length_1621_cov_43.514455_1_plen_41_part_00
MYILSKVLNLGAEDVYPGTGLNHNGGRIGGFGPTDGKLGH